MSADKDQLGPDGSLIRMKGIKKAFGAVHALKGVELIVGHGEIVGLVGDNAAGKSTLVKVLNGAYTPDSGEILFEGKRVTFHSPTDSREMGIEMIYQDFALVESLDIASNIFLGKEITVGLMSPLSRFLLKRRMENQARETLSSLGISVRDLGIKVSNLSGGERQLIAIARGMHFKPKLFIMDEPTANLSVRKIETLLKLIRDLKEKGMSVVIISHDLEAIFSIADRIMILWRGQNAGEVLPKEASMQDVVHLMMFGKSSENQGRTN